MFNYKNNQKEIFKILFLGLDGSGKSTIIAKLKDIKVCFKIYKTTIQLSRMMKWWKYILRHS